MGTSFSLVRTEFKDYNGTSYGYRAYDDYEQLYCNNWADKPNEDDKEFFLEVVDDGTAADLVSSCHDNQTGVTIDGTFYEFEEIVEWMTNKG